MKPRATSQASAIAAGARNKSGLGTGRPSQPRPRATTNSASTTMTAQQRTAQLNRQPRPIASGSARGDEQRPAEGRAAEAAGLETQRRAERQAAARGKTGAEQRVHQAARGSAS